MSIVVVTFGNLLFTRLCLESLLGNADYENYEIIVVDNASTDGTRDYLRELERLHPVVRVVLNETNRGFAPANNQGLGLATGDILILLNNDTIVPPGWLRGLVRHLELDASIGLLGPVTNRIGNEAEIASDYQTYGEMLHFSRKQMEDCAGRIFDIRTLCMYCLAMRREAYERIGPIDERFEVGMLEDDDYSRRAALAGYRVVCAEDVFVHHFGGASFGKLAADGEYHRILRANQRRYEEKWGVAWEPYSRRPDPGYESLTERIGGVVERLVPAGERFLVVSRGDDDLLRVDGRDGGHFPQMPDGTYAGQHPADGAEAVAQLEALRDKGAGYLLLPSTAFWWLEFYPELRRHLQERCGGAIHHDGDLALYPLR